ncbi:hypothetical protein OROHE_022234 [Orobanche hederae]
MSARSAFDVLMANASKNRTPSQSLLKPGKRTSRSESRTLTYATHHLEADCRENPVNTHNGLVAVKKMKVSISPDESVTELKKKAADFEVKKAAYWGEGERVPFMFVAKALDAVSEEKGRIVSIEIICNMPRAVMETTPDDLVAVMYLLSNKIAPGHEGLELRIENRSIIKAIAQAYGANEAYIMKQNEVTY